MAGQIAQAQADLQAAQEAATAAAGEVEAARADDREAKHMREQAIRGKRKAEKDKNTADSQLDELNSQRPDTADTVHSALQEALTAIYDKDAELRVLQQKVLAAQVHSGLKSPAAHQLSMESMRLDLHAISHSSFVVAEC